MKWVTKTKDFEVQLPDMISPGIWSAARLGTRAVEICWEPCLRTLFVREDAAAPEVPLKYRSVVSKRFAGEMYAEVVLEFVGGKGCGIQTLNGEWALSVPGLEGRSQAAGSQGESIRSPMVGKVLKVQVSAGQLVERGQELLVIEAMKMENKIFAKSGGRVGDLQAVVGQQVSVGQLMMVLRGE